MYGYKIMAANRSQQIILGVFHACDRLGIDSVQEIEYDEDFDVLTINGFLFPRHYVVGLLAILTQEQKRAA